MNSKDDMRLYIMKNKPLTEPVQLLFNLALVELFDPSKGYCEATMQDIADAMGRTRGIYRPLFKSEHK